MSATSRVIAGESFAIAFPTLPEDEGVTVQDLAGRLVYANEAAARQLGFDSARALLAAPLTAILDQFELLDEQGDPLPLDQLPGRRVVAGEPGAELVVCFRRRATGEEHRSSVQASPIVGPDGSVAYVLNIFHNLTERLHLLEAQQHLAAIVQGSSDAIFSKTMEGLITSWNLGAEQLYGYTPAEILGQPVSILMPEDRADDFPRLMGRLRRGERIEQYETVRQRKNGTLVDISLTISPIRDPAGTVVGASVIARDITERKRTDAERARLHAETQRALQEAEAAVRIRDQFLSIASHELRTPLTPLTGSLQILRRQLARGVPAEDLEEFVLRALHQVRRLTGLVNTMLDVARIAEGRLAIQRQPVPLVPLLRGVVELQQAASGPPHSVEFAASEGDPVALGDAARLEQVFTIILENAARYSPADTPIQVAASARDGEVRVDVCDRGIGIPPEELSRVFERFHRAPNVDPGISGMGLGLYIAREIVRAHGGEITVTSAPGAGSTFTVTLPAA